MEPVATGGLLDRLVVPIQNTVTTDASRSMFVPMPAPSDYFAHASPIIREPQPLRPFA